MDKAYIARKLKAARDLISQEGAWTQGNCARDTNGNSVSCHSDEATCFCMIGAIVHVAPDSWPTLSGALYGSDEALIDNGIAAWNDTPDRTQAEVVAMFDKAIEIAGAA